MGLLDALRTGSSGLRVASTGLSVTGHNVTNASTEGYTRRTLSRTTAEPVTKGGLLLGQGVRATGIASSTDRFVNANLVDAQGRYSRSASNLETLTGVESMFSMDSTGGIAETYSAFFESLRSLSADPSDLSRRTGTVGAAQSLTNSVREAASRMHGALDSIHEEFAVAMERMNACFEQVAALNGRISSTSTATGGGDAADQLMATVGELADEIGVKAVFGDDGTATVFIGGHAVVNGSSARTLSVERDADGLPSVKISLDSAEIDVTADLGGKLGGRMDAAGVVSDVLGDLDSFVSTFTDAVNAVHQAGYDRNGDAGGDLFTYDSTTPSDSFKVDPSVLSDGRLLALAGSSSAWAGDGDNLEALVDVQQQDLFGDGTRTGGEEISSIYATVGRAASNAQSDTDVHLAQSEDLQALRDAISGVDLDQEAAEMMAWQAAYEASARVVTTANDMLGELMNLVD